MIWALALGIATMLIGTAIFVFRRQFHIGQRDYQRALGFPESSPLEPKSDLGYALVRCIPLWVGGVALVILALFSPT